MAKRVKAKPKKIKRAAKKAKLISKNAKAVSRKPKVQKLKAIPDAYKAAIPYLIVNDGVAAIDFYKRAFGATEVMRFDMPGGKIAHAEMKIGDSLFMLADEFPEMGAVSPSTVGGTPVSVMVYVNDVDSFFAKAISEGAREERAVEDKFYGDRSGNLLDPFGHKWTFSTHKEDVSIEEMKRRMAEMQTQAADTASPSEPDNL